LEKEKVDRGREPPREMWKGSKKKRDDTSGGGRSGKGAEYVTRVRRKNFEGTSEVGRL